MGHRKHSAPRRGSLAYIPRGRVGDFFPTIHNWPRLKGGAPTLLAFPAVKVSTIHTTTMDDGAQLDYVTKVLGKSVKFSEVFKAGGYVDIIGVTKGHGYEGPVTRMGIKRKQHKSRKSVRAVGVIGPWHPAAVMYTVARAGQHGFHQRTEQGKRILSISNPKDAPITPKGGFEHFGELHTDYAMVRGSVPGSTR